MPPKRVVTPTLEEEVEDSPDNDTTDTSDDEEGGEEDDSKNNTDSFVEESVAVNMIKEVFGEQMLTTALAADLPINQFNNVWEIYDTFATIGLETEDLDEVKIFMEKFKQSLEIDVGFGKYDARGVVFSSPVFSKDRKKEILDVDRLRVGPKLMEGVQQCITRSCRLQPSVVVSREKQVSSADEPSTFFHSCRRCGEQWRTRG
jgi:hypothetical protein